MDKIGASGIVVIIVAVITIYFILTGMSWDGIDSFLGFGFLAYLFVSWVTS